MKSTIRTASAIGILTLLTAGRCILAQQSEGSQKRQMPSLDETISFMNKSVEPEMSSVSSVNSCEVYVARNRRFTFALPQGKTLKSTDRFGVPHYGFKWMTAEEPEVMRFNFTTIESSSVNSKPVPSIAFLRQHNPDENPSELKDADLTVVFFNTSNSTNSIDSGHFEVSSDGSGAKAVFDNQASMGFIVFESKDRAERFVTAFIHAVALCGGKSSDFAPTPSKP